MGKPRRIPGLPERVQHFTQNYSNSNFDIRQMFKGEVVYQLPFGKGKMFMNDNLIADEVLGGWELSSTYIAQGGNPDGSYHREQQHFGQPVGFRQAGRNSRRVTTRSPGRTTT